MRYKFDEQLNQLHSEMIKMGNMVEKAIQEAIDAFFNKNIKKAKQIMDEDELVNQEQKKIENICFNLLVQQQPVAKDLRAITAAMKIVTDMERIGDQAADIAEITVMLSDCPNALKEKNIKKMATETIIMLIQAVEAYVEGDMKKAYNVIIHDNIVDELFVKVKLNMIKTMQKHPEDAEYAADMLMVNKYLERIGDHATNIAEWVVFMLDDHT